MFLKILQLSMQRSGTSPCLNFIIPFSGVEEQFLQKFKGCAAGTEGLDAVKSAFADGWKIERLTHSSPLVLRDEKRLSFSSLLRGYLYG